MSSIFYRAVKAQDNLNEMFPNRNHPIAGNATPMVVECIRLFRTGMTIKDIALHLNEDYPKVAGAVSRSGLYRGTRPRNVRSR